MGVLLCINRNIVECKVDMPVTSTLRFRRINRNIVECKAMRVPTIEHMFLTCINRNIVECKVIILLGLLYWLSCINRNIVECKEDFAVF